MNYSNTTKLHQNATDAKQSPKQNIGFDHFLVETEWDEKWNLEEMKEGGKGYGDSLRTQEDLRPSVIGFWCLT